MKLSIKQFQELYFIAKSEDEDSDKALKMVGVVTGLIPEKVELIEHEKFNKICKDISKKFEFLSISADKNKCKKYIKANGRRYKINYHIDKNPMNAGKYVEAVTFGKDIIDNMHKLLATMAEPMRWSWGKMKWVKVDMNHEDIANNMESADFEVGYNAVLFFCLLFTASIQATLPYLTKQMKMKGVEENTIQELLNNSMSILDGLPMPRWSLTTKEYLLNRFGI